MPLIQEHLPEPSPRGPRRWLDRRSLGLASAFVLGAVAVRGLDVAKSAISEWAFERGHHRMDASTSFWREIWSVPGRLTGAPAVPHLRLEVKPEAMERLREKRSEALAKGLLETGADDLVRGKLTLGRRTIKVKLRLKGDWTDHLQGHKWSFRIQTSGDDHVLGLRRFSIQNPNTKGYHGESMYHASMRRAGVVAPRYDFVRASLNGADLGVMAIEEHFSKELLEHCRRRESVILRFDETLQFHGLDDYRTAPIEPFRSKRVTASGTLRRDYEIAHGLLRGFVDGRLAASEVFVVDELAVFLAVTELWGAHHGLRWHNLRFYFDPIVARLGPIAFDGNLNQRRPVGQSVVPHEPIAVRMLEDPAVRAAYRQSLTSVCRDVIDGGFGRELRQLEQRQLPVLQSEFALLAGFRFDELEDRARFHLGHRAALSHRPGILAEHPLLLRAYLGESRLELVNALAHPVRVHDIRWVSRIVEKRVAFDAHCELDLPFELAPQPPGAPAVVLAIPGEPKPEPQLTHLEIEASVGDQRQVITAVSYLPARSTRPVPVGDAGSQLRRHAFLREAGGTLRVEPGTWRVTEELVVPRGYTLAIPAGVRLRFDPGVALIAHGALRFAGTSERPIVLEGTPDWRGVAVLGAEPSRWEHVHVRGTSGVAAGEWRLTGGVTFHRSPVTFVGCEFHDSTAEDALNLVRSEFELRDTSFAGTASDAFDADFSDGVVARCEFRDVGGDGVDISGAVLDVANTRFFDVRDKALSVGEGSTMTARGISITRGGTGAACKDGSSLTLSDAEIDSPVFCGLAVYVKKPEYGPAAIEVERLSYRGEARRAVVQTDSRLVIDGTEVLTEDVDVDALYRTVMRK